MAGRGRKGMHKRKKWEMYSSRNAWQRYIEVVMISRDKGGGKVVDSKYDNG